MTSPAGPEDSRWNPPQIPAHRLSDMQTYKQLSTGDALAWEFDHAVLVSPSTTADKEPRSIGNPSKQYVVYYKCYLVLKNTQKWTDATTTVRKEPTMPETSDPASIDATLASGDVVAVLTTMAQKQDGALEVQQRMAEILAKLEERATREALKMKEREKERDKSEREERERGREREDDAMVFMDTSKMSRPQMLMRKIRVNGILKRRRKVFSDILGGRIEQRVFASTGSIQETRRRNDMLPGLVVGREEIVGVELLATLVIEDHVVQDDAGRHYHVKVVSLPHAGGTADDGEARLEHAERVPDFLGLRDDLDEGGPFGVDAIGERGGAGTKEMRELEDVEIVGAPGSPKNACHIHRSYDLTASSTMVGSCSSPKYKLAHASGQFFHTQCMQPSDPIIPGNPRASFSSSNLFTSSGVGANRYSPPNNSTIPSVNASCISKSSSCQSLHIRPPGQLPSHTTTSVEQRCPCAPLEPPAATLRSSSS
ncbi:hypothetical protein BDK51DRAFT_50090 [Blyttiomyces helicus]|uniref:Uncharacterized protein n=1 Tax=Blyttiomyces helicus TaxID=388810 RepID=A0A4P9WEH6_9FUNG|nr:hypothetical protein BDK51DRAFT_50090 [Blyttiomyces helicus]|eukprot:RKO90185.1 hypothetical protein BDK51DRAFT_50090 [Blyttiomyces helicus]